MKILVIGATGGSGRAAVEAALEQGHRVTAFSRRASSMQVESARFRAVDGDATDPDAVSEAVRGHDAVVVTLGITENPLRVRLFGPARTPLDVRSAGTRAVIEAMRRHSVRRLVVQTTFGVGPTRTLLPLFERLFFALLLKPQIADTEVQQRAVEASGLDWTVVQPVHLTDDDDDTAHLSTTGETGRMKVTRRAVGRVLIEAASASGLVGRTVSVSGVPAPAPRIRVSSTRSRGATIAHPVWSPRSPARPGGGDADASWGTAVRQGLEVGTGRPHGR